MTATDRSVVATAGATTPRLAGPDVVRAVALIGVVVMNFHGYLLLRGGAAGDGAAARFFDPWTGPLATRFAAAFVLVAGVGVTLLTRGAVGDRARMSARRWTLVRRGLALYAGGLLLDMVWPGTILPYYGAMFVVAAVVCTWRTAWIVVFGVAAAVAGAGLAWWRLERRLGGHDTSWLTTPGVRSPRGVLLDVAINGTHPLLPWLAFLCAGIVVGRALPTSGWQPRTGVLGVVLFGAGTLVGSLAGDGPHAALGSVDPLSRALPYTVSALGTALVAVAAITWVTDRRAGSSTIRLLGDAGAMTLTLYVAHALVFLLVVDHLGWVRPTGLDTALVFAAAYWIVAIAAAAAWRRHLGPGPVERLYRHLGG